MNSNLKLIQLFPDELFNSEVKECLGKIEESCILEQIDVTHFIGQEQSFITGSILFINSENLKLDSDFILIQSVFNHIVYIYDDENELVTSESVNKIADDILPREFSVPLFLSLIYRYSRNKLLEESVSPAFNLAFDGSIRKGIISGIAHEVDSRIFITDEACSFYGCNVNFANDHHLFSWDDLHNLKLENYWIHNSSNTIVERIGSVFKTGEIEKNIHLEIEFKSGNKRYPQIELFPLKDITGQTRFVMGIYQYEKMKRNQSVEHFPDWKLLQILMDNITDTIYFKDIDSKFVRINKAQARLIGVDRPEDAIGKTDFDYFNIEHATKALSDEKSIIKNATPINSIEYVGTKDGHYRWVSASKVPVLDEDGRVIGTVGITRDIDKIVKVEHRLKAERDLLQLLIDNIPSPIYFKDIESKFTRVNLAQAKVLGANSVEDVLGKSDFDFYSKEDAIEFFNNEQSIIEKEKPVMNKIEECIPPGEGLRWFSTTKIPIKNEDGELSGIVGVSHDITDQILVKKDLERAIEKAQVANTAKSNFLSNMSHEIRTPMNGVIGMAEILNMTDLSDEQRKIVDLIIRSGNNLLSIINDILDFSKIENGKIMIESAPMDVKLIIREVYEMFAFSASEKNISFYFKLDTNIPEIVKGDSLRLKQVLINLISNAIKFTKQGEVVIEACFIGNTDRTHCIIFKVIDTGIGISEGEKQNLFDAFTQADASSSRKYGGTGLGLAISSRLVDMMGGKLDVISEKGVGSTFFFDLCFEKMYIEDQDLI